MGYEVTIGGDRLGAGKRNKAHLHGYERSTHDIGYLWRSTMAAGTLVPFLSELALPGDTFDIHLDCDVLTHPTIGPLFGSYKIQLDVFQIPIRLYQAKLHMNMLGIGMDMAQVELPLLNLLGMGIDLTKPVDNQQINPSCIYSYLGIRGLGVLQSDAAETVTRKFNAIPLLAYWDIYKNYYANKQEEQGAVIHRDPTPDTTELDTVNIHDGIPTPYNILIEPTPPYTYEQIQATPTARIVIEVTLLTDQFDPNGLAFFTEVDGVPTVIYGYDLFENWAIGAPGTSAVIGTVPTQWFLDQLNLAIGAVQYNGMEIPEDYDTSPKVHFFPLENIDTMRTNILQWATPGPFEIGMTTLEPYGLPQKRDNDLAPTIIAQQFSQEGLALKTYQSDLFNNWIQTEWIDGADSITELTRIDTTGDTFTLDELNLNQKIYNMLNRIAISGGSYDDWQKAVYDHPKQSNAENPMYIGGLQKNLVFQEVISNAATPDQPLGTLAGRGKLGQKSKGGTIIAKVDEPSYVMGIISITPNVDYSQGNKWDVNLKTMNDLHKPALDEIGFQDLITDQMAWWDTQIDVTTPVFKSAGKQPAWINYMTNVNQVRGNFAEQNQQMFMTLNRRYETVLEAGFIVIKDLTTYIDPAKFNHIFADTQRDAQNFWAQIAVDITARRKMSAKVIPNL